MIELLEQLSLAAGVISRTDAIQVADAMNRRIRDLVDAQVVKLYWREEAEKGVILAPVTYIDKTQDSEPRPFQLDEAPKGILSYVYLTARPLWLEQIKKQDLNKSLRNKAEQDAEVPPAFLDMRSGYAWMDSMMAIPLIVRGDVRGIYSVELRVSGRLKESVLSLLQRLGKSVASLFWNADVYAYDQQKTSLAVRQFLDIIRKFSFDSLFLDEHYRAGFIARPFKPEFGVVEQELVRLLNSKGVEARHYEPSGEQGFMIADIEAQIRGSHFAIADLTGSNPNVLAEVGMMITMGKHLMLIRKRGDQTPRPFNLNQFPLYEYDVASNGRLNAWNAAVDSFEEFDLCLERFIQHLPAETGYFSAPSWSK
ncbi:MAG: hypothetical protein LC776_04915 [Acidobacteria bacterium]|nr:hypothetical protein [Acidobacteriota bacterium]